jgi:hypothetical protein
MSQRSESESTHPPSLPASSNPESPGPIANFIGFFAGNTTPTLSIEEINEIIAEGWAKGDGFKFEDDLA